MLDSHLQPAPLDFADLENLYGRAHAFALIQAMELAEGIALDPVVSLSGGERLAALFSRMRAKAGN